MLFNLLSFAAALLATAQADFAPPGPCTGFCQGHDPSIIQRDSDGVYFKFTTGGGMDIATSSALAGPWDNVGKVLPDGSVITTTEQNKDLWAPDVHKVGDGYHLYYAVSKSGSHISALGLATSPLLEPGSWADKGSVGIESDDKTAWNAIDANLVSTGDAYLLNFGSYWQDIFQAPMNGDATKVTADAPKQIQYQTDDLNNHPAEGAYMFWHDGYWYLLWSEGKCCGFDKNKAPPGQEYKVRMGRSESTGGPFVSRCCYVKGMDS